MTARDLTDMQYLLSIIINANIEHGVDVPPGHILASGVLLYTKGKKRVLSQMAAIAYDETQDPAIGNA